jgi:hypothetical protein
MKAIAIGTFCTKLALSAAIHFGRTLRHAGGESALSGRFALALRSTGFEAAFDQFVPMGRTLSLALLVRRDVAGCFV